MLTYLYFFFLAPSFFQFFLSFSLILFCLSFFLSLSLSLFLFLSFFLSFWRPLWWPRRARTPNPPDTPLPLCSLYPPVFLCLLSFFVLSSRKSRKFQLILQKVESRGRCCLLTSLPYFFDFPLVKHPPMPCRLILCVSKTFWFLMPLLCWTQTIFRYSPRYEWGEGQLILSGVISRGRQTDSEKGKSI